MVIFVFMGFKILKMFFKCVKFLNLIVDEVCNVDIFFLVGNYGVGLFEFFVFCFLRVNFYECWFNFCVINFFYYIDVERIFFNFVFFDGYI